MAQLVVFLSPGPEVIFFHAQHSCMNFSLLTNMKMPTIVDIFKFTSKENFMLSHVYHEIICNC